MGFFIVGIGVPGCTDRDDAELVVLVVCGKLVVTCLAWGALEVLRVVLVLGANDVVGAVGVSTSSRSSSSSKMLSC